MTLDVYYPEDVARILSASISTAMATAQSTAQMGGRVEMMYLYGLLAAHRATAIAFGVSWPQVVYEALCDLHDLTGIAGRATELSKQPLNQLLVELKQALNTA